MQLWQFHSGSIDGVLHVDGTRVTLDTLVIAFLDGATAEEIALGYPALNLPAIYSVISYYLQNQTEVEEYLQKRQFHAATIQDQNEQRFDPKGIRSRLLERCSN